MINCNSCSTYYSLGCFDNCTEIATGLIATQDGEHTFRISFLGTIIEGAQTLSIGEEFIIPTGIFNDSFENYFSIVMPSGANFTATFDAVDYSCFKFVTEIRY